MANQQAPQRTELVIRRIRYSRRADYLTPRGGWTNNPNLAQVFLSEGAARIVLRNRAGEIIPKPEF